MSPVTLKGLVPAIDLQACVVQHTAGHTRMLASLFDKMTPFDSFLKKARGIRSVGASRFRLASA